MKRSVTSRYKDQATLQRYQPPRPPEPGYPPRRRRFHAPLSRIIYERVCVCVERGEERKPDFSQRIHSRMTCVCLKRDRMRVNTDAPLIFITKAPRTGTNRRRNRGKQV